MTRRHDRRSSSWSSSPWLGLSALGHTVCTPVFNHIISPPPHPHPAHQIIIPIGLAVIWSSLNRCEICHECSVALRGREIDSANLRFIAHIFNFLMSVPPDLKQNVYDAPQRETQCYCEPPHLSITSTIRTNFCYRCVIDPTDCWLWQ